jgi:ribose-phosphate pyrophosphokinase
MKPLIIPGSQGVLAIGIARLTGFQLGHAQVENLPDGEKYVRLSSDVEGRDVILVNSFAPKPNELLVETLFLLDTIRDYGARSIIGVFPYFPYSRQDRRFMKGEAFSLKIAAKLLKNFGLDWMYVVDFHLHRVENLSDFLEIETKNLTAMRALASYLMQNFEFCHPIVVGPDEEAVQWASVVAEELGTDHLFLRKMRVDAENVIIDFTSGDVKGRDVIIVDDIISTGGTIVQAIKTLKRAGCSKVYVACTHAILARDALRRILEVGAEAIVGSDTVPSPVSHVSVSPIISKAIVEDLG